MLLTFDDWAYGDPYRATRIGAYLQSRNIRAAFFLINQNAKNYPGIVSTLRQQGHWVLNHTCGSSMIHALSLFRLRVNSRPTLTDDDRPRFTRPPWLGEDQQP